MIPGLGRFPEEESGNPLQNYCLGNPMNRGAWWAIVHGVTKESDIAAKQQHFVGLLLTVKGWFLSMQVK